MKISKSDAAKRQLETAIRLYINDEDEVSIHTLTAAACGIIGGVGKNIPIIEKINSSISKLKSWTCLNEDHLEKISQMIWQKQKEARESKKYKKVKDISMSELKDIFGKIDEMPIDRLKDAILLEINETLDVMEWKDPWKMVVDYFISRKIVKDEKEIFRSINAAQNFFKHADNDPNENLIFNPRQTEMMLYVACEYYSEVFEGFCLNFSRFQIWVVRQYPDLFVQSEFMNSIQSNEQLTKLWAESLKKSKKEFFAA